MADWCVVDEIDERGNWHPVAVAHVDQAKAAWATELRRRYPTNPDSVRGLPNVIRTGQPEIYPEITDDMLKLAAQDEEHLRILRELGLTSTMIVPLTARGRTFGTLSFFTAEQHRSYGPSDLAVAIELARRAALAVDNARLYREQSRVARTLQASLRPPRLPEIPGVELAAAFDPAGDGGEIGGDFYDLFRTGEDTWGVVIGDVCGKGASAAALTALARYTIRVAAMQGQSPSRVLSVLNDALLQQGSDDASCTAAYVSYFGSGRLIVSCGGHPLPLLLRANGEVERVGRSGTLLGAFEEPDLAEEEAKLEPGDSLLLFTDGVVEARSKQEAFDENALERMLSSCAGLPADVIVRRIESEVLGVQKGRPRDDVALLLLRVPS
jgi:serine phosphatase RsbU (regulator of sigma subunit)